MALPVAASWQVGTATVTRIKEQTCLSMISPEKNFPGFEREVLKRHLDWLVPNHYSPEHDCMLSSFHSWLIRTEHGGRRQTILLDACSGNHKPRPWQPRFNQLDTPYMERLRAAGAQPEDIDIVLCTHLHADHVGWNTIERDGRWVPTFPNVRYLFSRTDADYWNQRSNPKMANDPRRVVYEDSILPVIETGQAVLVEGSHAIDDHLLIEPAPGHTPGLVILKMDLSGTAPAGATNTGRAIFCGDVLHHALQVYAPHWAHIVDEDPALAKITRRRVLEQCAESGSILFPAHFGAPHVARIVESGGGFAPQFVTAA